jgi:alpha/beta superfamily hydrolase
VPQLAALSIPAPHGTLEGLLRQADVPTEVRMAAVVCHPHPLGGGTMHSKVVFRVAQALGEVGMPVLRFNFRGVGRSTGLFDQGRGEADDVRAALDRLATLYPGVPLCLAGASFGAWVGLPVGCADARVRQIVGVAVPVETLDMVTLARCARPKLIVQGEDDEYGPLPALEHWFAALPEPKRLAIVPGADHLFSGHQAELRAAIVAYFRA